MNLKKLLLVTIFSINLISSNYAYSKDAPEQEIAIPNEISDVILPTTSEAMSFFEKLHQKAIIPNTPTIETNSKIKLAMNLGLSGADAAAALKNKDVAKFNAISLRMLSYAGKLDIGKELVLQAVKVNEAVSKKDWKRVESLLDKMKSDLILLLKVKNKKNEGTLASAVGWVEGLYIMTETVKNKYNDQFSGAFYVGDTISYMVKNINNMPSDIKDTKECSAIITYLPKIAEIVSKKNITESEFKDLNNYSSKIRNAVIN